MGLASFHRARTQGSLEKPPIPGLGQDDGEEASGVSESGQEDLGASLRRFPPNKDGT